MKLKIYRCNLINDEDSEFYLLKNDYIFYAFYLKVIHNKKWIYLYE